MAISALTTECGHSCCMSAATADRMVRRLREADRPHGISTTKPGRLLKRQVPVGTFSEWSDLRPGFFEADLNRLA
jgi:hypothetical protein